MVYALLAGAVGAMIGFALGVLAMVFLTASQTDERRAPHACAYPQRECLAAQQSSGRA